MVQYGGLTWPVEMQREVRARILAEAIDPDPTIVLGRLAREFDHMFLLGDPPDYEQPFEQSIRARALRAGVTPEELVYDLMLERDGHNMLYVTLCNYEYGSLESSLAMMRHPGAVNWAAFDPAGQRQDLGALAGRRPLGGEPG